MNTRWPRTLALILWIGMTSAGCVTFPHRASPRPPQAAPETLAAYYRHTPYPLAQTREPLYKEPSSRWQAEQVTLTAPELPYPIRLDWYAPSFPGRHAAVLIFPILWGNDLGVRDFAQAFARHGIHGIIVYRPKEKFSLEKPLSQIEDHLRASVLAARHAIDWLETQPTIDPGRLGSLGISMGSTLNVLVASIEPRLKRYVFCLPASHLAHVIMTTRDDSIAKKRDEYLRRHGLTQVSAEAQMTDLLLSEPLRVAGAIDPARSYVVIALGDRVIGWKNSLDIWKALGRSPCLWLPTGHYTSLFALPYVKVKVLWFFSTWWDRPPPNRPPPGRRER